MGFSPHIYSYFCSKLNCDNVYLGQASGTSKDVTVPKGISWPFLFHLKKIYCGVTKERGIAVSDRSIQPIR